MYIYIYILGDSSEAWKDFFGGGCGGGEGGGGAGGMWQVRLESGLSDSHIGH